MAMLSAAAAAGQMSSERTQQLHAQDQDAVQLTHTCDCAACPDSDLPSPNAS